MIKKLTILYIALCVSTPSAFAQKKGLVKGVAEALSSKMPSAVSAQVERQLAQSTVGARLEAQLSKQITDYHPVFGYTLPTKPVLSHNLDLRTPFHSAEMDPTALIQVKPILDKRRIQIAFEMYKELDIPQTTQMLYLWGLAHPKTNLLKVAFHIGGWEYVLQREGMNQVIKGYRAADYDNKLENLPNMLFLKMLTSSQFISQSYAELYENITCYPQHITLNEYGFPVETKYADYAKELDIYLMLSNPKEMGAYNNAGKYTPFVLTKEEHEAADDLLALRMREDKIPQNPTARDLLGLAYNRLATHTVPYSKIGLSLDTGRWNVDSDYKTYPNYKNTQLYRTIKGMLKGENPEYYADDLMETDINDVDILHLFVLDAVMGGVDPNNLKEVDRVLTAFDKLIALSPWWEQVDKHLEILQDNLRFVFRDLILFNYNKEIKLSDTTNPQWFQAKVADKLRHLLGVRIKTYHPNRRYPLNYEE